MIKISKLEPQKNNKGRYNVFIKKNEKDYFFAGVDQEIILKYSINKDTLFDEIDLQNIIFEDNLKKATSVCYNYLSYRMRSRLELITHLQKKDYTQSVIDKVLSKLSALNLINDQAFASHYVKQQINHGKKGPKLIINELNSKGVSENYINDALSIYTEEKQIDNIEKIIVKKIKTIKKSKIETQNTILNYLLSKGYNSDLIKTSIYRLDDTFPNEKLALEKHAEKAHRKYQLLEPQAYQQKMKRYLYQKGFNIDLINNFLEKRT